MKRIIKLVISLVLSFTCVLQPCSAFAASITGKTYVKEMIISYGKTENDAKTWLKNKGYKIIDNNFNEGADDTFSTKRAVYLGYKTTSNVDEAITDMKLMNMKGNYSVEDYQLLLEEQKAGIKIFINNFITAINEYRDNYKKGQERAVAAHDILNLMYDDDTEQNLGDLFLNKIKEEYTDAQFNALSKSEQNQIADMTTILMQSNATAVLAIEQIIALATDSGDSVWSERYLSAKTYDDMIEDLMDNENLNLSKAVSKLASEYDTDAKAISSKLDDYKTYLSAYTDSEIKLTNTKEEIDAYFADKDSLEYASWYTAGVQYEALNLLENDGESLADLIFDDDYDLETEDRSLLYPLVSVLTEGQRACLDFLPMYQLVSLGINDNDSIKTAMEKFDYDLVEEGSISIYDGVDRSIFSSQVALTNAASNLQNSTGKDYSGNWFNEGISTATKVLCVAFGVTVIATGASLVASNLLAKAAKNFELRTSIMENGGVDDVIDGVVKHINNVSSENFEGLENEELKLLREFTKSGNARFWSKALRYIGLATTVISVLLMGFSLISTYNDLKEYYNVDFTPIPMHMVNQGIDENNEKVYTYYTAVKCNREEAQMVTDNTKLLGAYGDLNGDVGKQWVALYTTTDKSAGDPITAKFLVQYSNSNIPDDDTALSMFGESVAQNLTNEKAGYTYSNDKNGIYLFYSTDATAYAGSIFSNGFYAMIGAGVMSVIAVVSYFVIYGIKKKKNKTGGRAYA